MEELNRTQLEIVEHKDGPILVLATPGSGKTHTVCRRMKWLVEKYGVLSEKICVVTFTKYAANEMMHRVAASMNGDVGFNIGTIHSLCYKIILSYSRNSNLEILSETKKQQLLRVVFHTKFPNQQQNQEEIRILSARMSYYYAHPQALHVNEKDVELFYCYRKLKREQGVYDFDDLIENAKEILEKNPEILSMWQEKFLYYMVDEFQDVNRNQLEVLHLLSKGHNNIMVVGDDDQSIYGFCGAMPGIFKTFEELYPQAVRKNLVINYRSNQAIIKLGQKCIRNNKCRYAKDITGQKKDCGKVDFRLYKDEIEEVCTVMGIIERMNQVAKHGESFAILFRTNYQMERFQKLACAMNFNIAKTYKKEMERIQGDIRAYCSLIKDEDTQEDIIRIMNRPHRGIERVFISSSRKSFVSWKKFCKDCGEDYQVRVIQQFQSEIEMLKTLNVELGIKYLLYGCGYKQVIERELHPFDTNGSVVDEVLEWLLEMGKKSSDWNDFLEKTNKMSEKFLSQVMHKKSNVFMLTMHASKGLEFEYVFLPNLIEKVIPGKDCENEEIEEERRLFFVAITRAKKEIYLSCAENRAKDGERRSRFLKELGY